LAPDQQLELTNADVAHALMAKSRVEKADATLQAAMAELQTAKDVRAALGVAAADAAVEAEKAKAVAGAVGSLGSAGSAVPAAQNGRPLDAPPKP
jgi:hypothetical protein